MPPRNVRTIRDLIYWEYAKLIAERAVGDRRNYRFVMNRFMALKNGRLRPSTILRENRLLVKSNNECAYCGSTTDLQWEHIVPLCRGGPDTIDNQVLACRRCNQEKGARDPFEWYGRDRRYEIPRLVLGKYLKIVFHLHEEAGTLDDADLNRDGRLDVYDLGAILPRRTRDTRQEGGGR